MFRNIREYSELYSECQFCGKALTTRISGQYQPTDLSYHMDFDQTSFTTSLERDINHIISKLGDTPKLRFLSEEYPNSLTYFYTINNTNYPILSIDKDTSKVTGNIDNMQRVFWDHKLSIIRICDSQECKDPMRGYVSDTKELVLERKQGIIYPFYFKIEALHVNLGDKKYALSSMYELKRTYLMSLDRGIDLMQPLPFMNLYKIKGGETIIQKVKTILVFS